MGAQEPNIPYGGTTGERLKAFALNEQTRERLSALATRYWEIASYAAIALCAAVLRFYNLGARAMHHDESLHGFFSYGFTKGLRDLVTLDGPTDTYKHVPFMHGPFQFIGNGFMMFFFGDGEFQARMLAATMGTGMVLLPFLFRKRLGTAGALAAALFIAFSPTLLYYSRFTREDIYTAFWTLGIVIFMWRYIDSRDDKFLYLAVGFMAGSFCTKETTFLTVIAFLFFMDFMLARHIAEKIRAKSPEMTDLQFGAITVGLLFVAWAIAIGWNFLADWRARYELDEMPPQATLLVVMGSLALPLYAALFQLFPGLNEHWRDNKWPTGNNDAGNYHIADHEFTAAMVSMFGLIAVSTAIGMLWKPRVWLIAAACFWVPFVLLYTTFFTNPAGFFSGLWGSADYWISQQDVRRGNQPDYYYFITIPVYEFLPLALSLAAMAYCAIRGQLRNALIVGGGLLAILFLLILPPGPDIAKVSSLHIILPFLLVLVALFLFPMDMFDRFLFFWLVITSFALTVAGEKMPWLNVHIALPLCVIAGRFAGGVIERGDLREDLPKFDRLAPFFYAAAASALAILVFVTVGPFEFASFGGWILVAVAVASVYWASTGYSRKTAMQVAVVGAVAAFSIFSLRAAVLASWGHPTLPARDAQGVGDLSALNGRRDHGDVPVELLVYTQTSGDIPVLMDKIAEYAKETGQGEGVKVVVDSTDGYTWPWAWYLRNYHNAEFPAIGANYQAPPNAIVLAAKQNAQNVQLTGEYDQTPYHHRRWFPEEYRGADGKYSTHNFFSDLFSAKELRNWLHYWVRRTPPADLGTVDGVAFFPKGIVNIPTKPVGPTVRSEGTQLVIGGQGIAPGQLSQPADVALVAAGNIYVADTNNNRIEKYDPQGNWLASAGGFSSSVKMQQPWSLTVAPDGTVFVADTWSHRILRLDKDLNQEKEWGAGCTTFPTCDEFHLFGPRDIAVTSTGNVLVADTGNARVVEYTRDGDFVRQFGTKAKAGEASDPLKFNEPVGIAAAPNGDIFVADYWNKRIVHLDKDLKSKGEIQVPTWGSNQVTDRPYLALLPDGRLLATDPNPKAAACDGSESEPGECKTPQDGKVRVFDAAGAPLGVYDVPRDAQATLARPIGIATDGTSVLVVDAASSVVRKIPLADVVK